MPEKQVQPELTIIAGPNGSGKSTFFNSHLKSEFPVFVNADEIAAHLSGLPGDTREIVAAQRAEAERDRLVAEGTSFAFETVFSRTDYWLRFIEHAKERGFFVRLFFLCTDNPLLNAARVETRVRAGGHTVPIDKIHSRYGGSIRTAVQAMTLVDRLWLYDNSPLNRNPRAIATLVSGKLVYAGQHRPRWAEPFFERLKP